MGGGGERECFVYILAHRSYTICVIFWELYPKFLILADSIQNAGNNDIFKILWEIIGVWKRKTNSETQLIVVFYRDENNDIITTYSRARRT